MKKDFKTQVSKEHYTNYDSLPRFISYFNQINFILKTKPQTVLEIGIGNKVVYNYIKTKNINITGCDFDKNLNPDILADIRKLPFKNKEFDTSVAFEVLEHIPFKDVQKALLELKRVSKKYTIISIPYNCAFLSTNIYFRLPLLKKRISFKITIPNFIKTVKINSKNKEHYWELGTKGYSKKRIRKLLSKHFKIEKEFSDSHNPSHYFFILKI